MGLASLFKPGRILIEKLRFGTKFVLVGVVLLIPLAILFHANWSRISADIAFAEKERLGLQAIEPAMRFMQQAQLHRRYSRDLLQGNTQAAGLLAEVRSKADAALDVWAKEDAKTGVLLGANQVFSEIRNEWESVKARATSVSLADSMVLHGKLVDSVAHYFTLVEDNANLTLDPDTDSFFLQDAAIVRVPAAADALRLLRAGSIIASKQKSLGTDERINMMVWLDNAEAGVQALQADYRKAFKHNPALQETLGVAVTRMQERSSAFIKAVRDDIIAPAKIEIEETKITSLGNDAVEGLYAVFDQTLPVIDKLLVDRIARYKAELTRDQLISALSLLVALYLFASLRVSVVSQISNMKQAIDYIAEGDFRHPVVASSRDEIGSFALQLDKVRTDLGKKIEAERAQADQMTRIKIALDNGSTPFRIADQTGTVVYANAQMYNVLRSVESTLKERNPAFTLDTFIGSSIGNLMEHPTEYLAKLSAITHSVKTEMEIGGRIFDVITTPVITEKGERLGTIGEWIDRTEQVALEREMSAIVSGAAAGDFSHRLSLEGKHGFFLTLGQNMNQLLATSQQGLNDVAEILKSLARGDLTREMSGNYQGLFGQVQSDANSTVTQLKEVVSSIKDAIEAINTAAQEIAAGNSDLSGRTEEQASSLEETASSMEELSSTVKQNAANARQANTLAANANDLASRGGEMVQRVVTTMGDIQDSSKKIADIIGVIDSIAFQTNILALNAAVEAARAGEQGRGFAVVASEVRSLAQRSATAAKEIKELIAASVDKVEDGAHLVEEAGKTMTEVVASFSQVATLVTDISNASREQAAGIEQVSKAVVQMDEVTQQNAALVEEAAAAAESLEDQARGLLQAVAMFKLSDDPTGLLAGPVLRDATPRQLARTPVNSRPEHRRGGRAIPAPHASSPDDEWQEF